MSDKPQLHYSMLDMMSRCGIQFQRRYGARFNVWENEEIIPPNVALVTGISTHKSIEANLKNKIANSELLPRDQVLSVARDSVMGCYNAGMLFTEEETLDTKATVGEMVDLTVKLARLHYDEVAPRITPVAVEEKWVLVLKDQPYDLAGTIDVREASALRDTKTAKSSPNQDDAKSLQMGVYSLAHNVLYDRLPERVYIDALVKTKVPKAVTVEATPDASWFPPVFARINRAIEIIDAVKSGKKSFAPADPDHWCCTRKFCGYARTCPFWSGR